MAEFVWVLLERICIIEGAEMVTHQSQILGWASTSKDERKEVQNPDLDVVLLKGTLDTLQFRDEPFVLSRKNKRY
jgi:hypothetical protein